MMLPIEDRIFAVLNSILAPDVEVIFGEDNGEQSGRPYVAMVLRWAKGLPPHFGVVDDAGNQAVSTYKTGTLELQCYGKGSFQILDTLVLKLQAPGFSDLSESSGVSFYEFGQIKRIPILLDGVKYRPRALIEIGVAYTASINSPVGIIDSVEIAGTTTGTHITPPPVGIEAE